VRQDITAEPTDHFWALGWQECVPVVAEGRLTIRQVAYKTLRSLLLTSSNHCMILSGPRWRRWVCRAHACMPAVCRQPVIDLLIVQLLLSPEHASELRLISSVYHASRAIPLSSTCCATLALLKHHHAHTTAHVPPLSKPQGATQGRIHRRSHTVCLSGGSFTTI
jgi:hypothetical protein